TGVTVRSVAAGIVTAVRWAFATARGDDAADTVADHDEPTDPFGRALAEGRQGTLGGVGAVAAVGTADGDAGEAIDPNLADDDLPGDHDEAVLEPVVLPEAATKPGKGEQLE